MATIKHIAEKQKKWKHKNHQNKLGSRINLKIQHSQYTLIITIILV